MRRTENEPLARGIQILKQKPLLSICSGWLLIASLLCMAIRIASAQFPNNFGAKLRRIASAKSWRIDSFHDTYQWLPDGRLLIWIGTEDHIHVQLLDPRTGQHDPLLLFNHLVFSASPPSTAIRFLSLSPDGKTELTFIGPFMGRPTFYRTLTLNGYQMRIYPLNRHFAWLGDIAWEWNDHYHGWLSYGSFNNGRTARVQAVAHFDFAHPEEPRIVEIPDALLPEWTFNGDDHAILIGTASTGEGILAPPYNIMLLHPSWGRQHKVPISLIDIDEGKRLPKTYQISIPTEAEVQTFVLSPDANHLAWLLRFQKPHPLPEQTSLFASDEIWISDLDGSHMHQLAYQAVRIKTTEDGLHFLAWKDNQTVSFILDKVLYSLPVSPQ